MPGDPVVVTGLGVCTAVAKSAAEFRDVLRGGAPAHALEGAVRICGFDFAGRLSALGLAAGAAAAAQRAGRRAPLTVQLSICAALEAVNQAGLLPGRSYAPEEVSLVVAGHNLTPRDSYEAVERYKSGLEFVPASHALHSMDSDQIGVLSETLGIRGEGFTTGAASASGNAGLIQGLRLVASGRTRACVVVGAMTDLSPLELHSLRNGGAMAWDGPCRPFDRDRTGFIYAQGSAALVLESAAGASERAQPPLGRLRGGAQCLDANRSSNPSPPGEARAMTNALADAGVRADEVDYVNTHGTGSIAGDQAEYDAIREVFGARFPRVWLNATKAIAGHCLSAAGVVEAAAVLIQMNGGFLHRTPGLEHAIGSEGRFVGPETIDAPVRLALSNSFGFGGINTSLVIERI